MGKWRNGSGTLTVVPGPRPGAHRPGPGAGAREITLRIAASYRARAKGLLGVDGVDGALLITPCGSVHTFRMRFGIDVAYLDREFNVLAVRTMRPGRLGLPRPRARHVLEAEAGAMAGWGLRPGSRVRISADPPGEASAPGDTSAPGEASAPGR
ncbi:DUF192 domain-containing protein [Streptomyces sp. NBC_01754]|uniref:DUF192 domain-containing protein n=1 Tax=Streptomyces sp. NBC_01754 TaxID=2975930 RepID=UPI002DDC1939|nr:DUF192 domain-containing protein [Streptomyces sp. NBC_01754]WSC94564.1 DUF192 domain-containing protein [Streptomyces sp. NBC_01754]